MKRKSHWNLCVDRFVGIFKFRSFCRSFSLEACVEVRIKLVLLRLVVSLCLSFQSSVELVYAYEYMSAWVLNCLKVFICIIWTIYRRTREWYWKTRRKIEYAGIKLYDEYKVDKNSVCFFNFHRGSGIVMKCLAIVIIGCIPTDPFLNMWHKVPCKWIYSHKRWQF